MAAESESAADFTDEQLREMAFWSRFILTALVVVVFGTIVAAWIKGRSDAKPHRSEKNSVVVNMGGEGGEGGASEWPPPYPHSPPMRLLLDLDVNAVAGAPAQPQRTGSESDSGARSQTVDIINVSGTSSSQAPPSGGRGNLTVVLGGEKRLEKPPRSETGPKNNLCEAPCPACEDRDGSGEESKPCASAELLGRVGFEPGRRRVLWSHGEETKTIEEIAKRLFEKTGAVLVVGHADGCGRSRLAKRRAKRVRRDLGDLLKDRSSGGIRIHAQAAGQDSGAPEGSCVAQYYGTAGVYLIEGLN